MTRPTIVEGMVRKGGINRAPPSKSRPAPKPFRPACRIPITAAEHIAKEYGYDQVIIYARRVGENLPPPHEYLTTYGRTRKHCSVVGAIGKRLRELIWANS